MSWWDFLFETPEEYRSRMQCEMMKDEEDRKAFQRRAKEISACWHEWDGDFCKKCGVSKAFSGAFPYKPDPEGDNQRKQMKLKSKGIFHLLSKQISACKHEWVRFRGLDFCKKCGVSKEEYSEEIKKRKP